MHNLALIGDLRGSLAVALLWLAGTATTFGADTYANGLLTVPSIVIGSTTYNNMVVGNLAIDNPPLNTTVPSSFLQDYYDPATNRLRVSTATYNGNDFFDVLVTVGSLQQVGTVSGAANYDSAGHTLTIPAVQLQGGPVYTNVVINGVLLANVKHVYGGMPMLVQNQATTIPAEPGHIQVTLPSVTVAGHSYQNVVLDILPCYPIGTPPPGNAPASCVQVIPGGAEIVDAVQHSFSGNGGLNGSIDAAQPGAAIYKGADGFFYGTSPFGGANNQGTIFKVDSSGNVTVLHSFGGAGDGASPFAGVVQDASGNLYGTTSAGGANGTGTVFKLAPSGTVTLLHSFGPAQGASTDGADPNGVILASDGNLYGTTYRGGVTATSAHPGLGTVFALNPGNPGSYTVLHSFGGYAAGDGANPLAGLVESGGLLYGTTTSGGPYGAGAGTVFRITPAGVETVLYAFTGNGGVAFSPDGALPQGPLMLASDGNFYGTTYSGGVYGAGTVFRITPAGAETVLHSFSGDGAAGGAVAANGVGALGLTVDGAYPSSGLVQDPTSGNLYGTTSAGGAFNQGTAFRLTLGGVETVRHSFNGYGQAGASADGAFPGGGVLIGSDAKSLIGTSYRGGANGQGSVFRIPSAVP